MAVSLVALVKRGLALKWRVPLWLPFRGAGEAQEGAALHTRHREADGHANGGTSEDRVQWLLTQKAS